ncbi:hypothetical protein [Treponema sp.]|uniref:hypothetical protein n=1 Tax=Treponema sp. TaxID=166 RepID=UPI00298DFE58|nr:hypothetical protein [Treponema sp.]MCR5613245.1 hypothetical protein [Treponema sp.]
MFDKLNEKRIYMDAIFCGLVASLISLAYVVILQFTLNEVFDGSVLLFICIFSPGILLTIYSALKGLVPGLVAFIEWIVLFFIICTVFSWFDFGVAVNLGATVSLVLGIINLFPLISSVAAGLITTLSRKRVIAVIVGLGILFACIFAGWMGICTAF